MLCKSRMDHVPWVEKYRPRKFEDIVLEKNNKIILNNILNGASFPNLLFYGPPGTGKTTTIINLIDKYQEANDQKRKGLKIHLNASDDRGIDIIRNQINQFVNTKTLFGEGTKFVILDEVDYMTKNAQQALRYLKPENLYVGPDCGLAMLPLDIAIKKLKNMVAATKLINSQ